MSISQTGKGNDRIRRVLITGGSEGFGFQLALSFVADGWQVFICGRDEKKLRSAVSTMEDHLSTDLTKQVFYVVCDVSNHNAVTSMFASIAHQIGGLEVLVNNAGIYGPFGALNDVDMNSWVDAISVNLLGSVYCAAEALKIFKRTGFGRIIQMSGGGATSPMPMISSYAAAKAGIVRLIESIALESGGLDITANSVAPGALNTSMLDRVLEAGPEAVGSSFYNKALAQKESGGSDMRRSIELIKFLTSDQASGINGKLISALWDNWSIWPDYAEDLCASDAYTLRRITGSERGFESGDRV